MSSVAEFSCLIIDLRYKVTAYFKKSSNFVTNKCIIRMTTEGNGIIRPNRTEILEYRKILAAARDGELIRLRNGLYASPDTLTSSIIDIEAIIPGGILCLYSAWYIYELTTSIPQAYYVAVAKSRKLTIPKFPDIKIVYQKEDLLDIGKTYISIDNIPLSITNRERAVCDAVKYRNKIGLDVMNEIVDNYLSLKTRNISRLIDYGRSLRVYSTLQQILQFKL